MPRPEKSASSVRPEGDSSPGHFLQGYYFVPMPDLNDETIWTINAGRSMPALIAVLRALHDQHRRGRNEEIRADAAGGRLTIGLKALSRANGMQTSSLLRQLRFLERAGLLKAHEGERVVERDPVTGKILKGRGRTPPKVIVMTLDRSMMRGGRRAAETGRIPSQKPEETGRIPSLSPHALRDGKRPPSREHTHKGCVPMEHTGRREHPAQGGRSAPPPQADKQPAAGRPEESPADAQARQAKNEHLARLYAEGLGITYAEVVDLWKHDQQTLAGRLKNAGIDWRTGKAAPLTSMIDGPTRQVRSARTRCQQPDSTPQVVSDRMKGLEALEEGERYIPSRNSAFAVRRQTTDSLTVCPSVAGEAAQALDGPPESIEERKAVIFRDLNAYQGQAGLTAGEAGAGAA